MLARMKAPGTILLSGINGSTAYGLATPESDIDRIGCYAAPTEEFHGLHLPIGKKATWTNPAGSKPDFTYHEAAKLCNLLLSCNPTVTELLWLESYEEIDTEGRKLIDIRETFLYADGVRNAYLGYATQQFGRIKSRGDGSFSADTRKRTAKHARHLRRLLEQGIELHQTGHLTIRLSTDKAAVCRTFGERVAEGDLELARRAIKYAEETFDHKGVLPSAPSEEDAEDWLRYVRRYNWQWLQALAIVVLKLGLGHVAGHFLSTAVLHGPAHPVPLGGVRLRRLDLFAVVARQGRLGLRQVVFVIHRHRPVHQVSRKLRAYINDRVLLSADRGKVERVCEPDAAQVPGDGTEWLGRQLRAVVAR